MRSSATTVEKYIEALPEERRAPVAALRDVIRTSLPDGFHESIGYGMLAWVVPHEAFPAGYHCDPKLPLPFLNLASQKQFIALYHMGLYADPELLAWFVEEWPKHTKARLDMGKSCVRLKKLDQIPFTLIGELCTRMTPQQWIELYQRGLAAPRDR